MVIFVFTGIILKRGEKKEGEERGGGGGKERKYTKFVKFAELYLPHFTTFRDQTLQFY